jgi:hypothetical protein
VSSFLDELRAEEAAARAKSKKTLFIPGSAFGVRFRPPAREKLDAFLAAWRANALDRDDEVQFLIDCADQVVRRNGSEDGAPIDEDEPLRFDGSDPRWGLAEHGTARQAVAKLYKLDVHPLSATGHVQALVPWLQGLEAELARDIEEAGKADRAAPESSTRPE